MILKNSFFHRYLLYHFFLLSYFPSRAFFYTLPPLLFIYMSENLIICAFVFIYVCLKMTTPIGRKRSTTKAMKDDFSNVNDWCRANRINPNPKKYECFPFARASTTDSLYLSGTVLNSSTSVKYLGIRIDTKLTFFLHIGLISRSSDQFNVLCIKHDIASQNTIHLVFTKFLLDCS